MLRGVLRIDVAESYLGGSNASIVLGTELSLLRANNKALVLASPRHIPLANFFSLFSLEISEILFHFSLTYSRILNSGREFFR